MAYDKLLKHRDLHSTESVAVTWCTWERSRLLVDPRVAECVMHAIRDIEGRGHCCAHAYVVMPDHVHCLLTPSGTRSLYDVVRAFKAIATREMRVRDTVHFGKVWQRGYYEHRIRQDEDLRAQARHIVANALRAGLVSKLTDYPWWFAEWAAPPFGRAGLPNASATAAQSSEHASLIEKACD